jgi:RNase adapter protein RapZ
MVTTARYTGPVSDLQVLVVTGMSGAGRSTALHCLEDLGFFCVDNLPPSLAPELVSMLRHDRQLTRVAFGMDVRTGAFLEGADRVLDELERGGYEVHILFLDCADEGLVRRFSETRRPHPLAPDGNLYSAIAVERERLAPLRTRARYVIDTTRLTVHDLRRMLVDLVARAGSPPKMVTRIVSFGFKYGLPNDADLVFDLRYLPNPHFVPELRPLLGTDVTVAKFVMDAPEARELVDDLESLLGRMLPRYEREGKAYLTVALGCTGGRHRSVALAEELGNRLRPDREILVLHRDAGRNPA